MIARSSVQGFEAFRRAKTDSRQFVKTANGGQLHAKVCFAAWLSCIRACWPSARIQTLQRIRGKQYMLALVHVVRPLSHFTSARRITADQCPARIAAGPIPYDSERW